ncbi:DUF2155 domain-containing protein [Zavarzinia aquatilis]|uniref:DUF2155 domain-containing protein n=1 Tax=Zavarzinia aquatilis TaxID=2211142 RepID=A0A317EK07_9PROT|nr:DUF2155 domain-containing protein [Zavarzinia aquatilis]PWR25753.1 DUF2155 domain-containing protein [Zavarzinia aquatilis]
MKAAHALALAAALTLAAPALAQTATESPADAAPPTEDVPTDVEPVVPPGGESPSAPAPVVGGVVTGVILQGLDKVSARTSVVEVPLDGTATFGTLTIRARQCITAPPDEKPETSAFLEIADTPPGHDPLPVFSGWMFASSPALSALEHPVYDVWVTACKMAAPGKP